MTQLVITIENNSIVPHLKKILGAIEGVKISRLPKIQRDKKGTEVKAKTKALDSETAEWIKKMEWLSDNFDPSGIDMTDEKTKYILSDLS